ncbi:MAG: T9SS type A sorting domain-containing protein, partial [Bacteroidia bacterium]|nr:T9SS type A sorting domain-containing protein [Bacteroidia bacterium]
PPYAYSWNTVPATTTASATGLSAGVYTVMIADANGCVTSALVIITQPSSPLVINANPTNISCYGGSDGAIDITVSGGTPPYSYLWTDGSTDEDRTGLTAGAYTVVVTDANGCVITLCTVLSEPSELICATSKSDVKCNGANTGMAGVAAAGGIPPYTYLWSNGETSTNISGLSVGTYTVTITDDNGCTTSCEAVIGQSSVVIVGNATITNTSCHDAMDGMATLNPSGGTPPYMFSWSNGQVSQTATGLGMGTYVVTITDDNGCVLVDTASIIIGGPDAIVLSITDSAETCFFDSDLSPYQHGQFFYDQWVGVTITATANGNGVDTVIIFDSNVNGTADPDLEVNIGPMLIIPDNIVDTNSNGLVDDPNDNGTGGVMIFEFDECVTINSFVFVDQDFNTLPVVTAYDSLGNIITQVTVPNMGESSVQVVALNASCVSKLEISAVTSFAVTGFDIDCNTVQGGCVNGSVDLTPMGGTPAYTYMWSNGATTEDLSGVPCATYTVTVTDANGCSATRSITITPMNIAIDSIASSNTSGPGMSDAQATVYASGGLLPYGYSWNTAPTQTTQTATGLTSGTYTVVVSDADGCTVTDSVTILDNPSPKFTNNEIVEDIWDVKVYPNPTDDLATLKIETSTSERLIVKLLDTKGSIAFEKQINTIEGINEINYSLGNMPRGIYQLMIYSDKHSDVIRIVLE